MTRQETSPRRHLHAARQRRAITKDHDPVTDEIFRQAFSAQLQHHPNLRRPPPMFFPRLSRPPTHNAYSPNALTTLNRVPTHTYLQSSPPSALRFVTEAVLPLQLSLLRLLEGLPTVFG